ncbi:MAG: L,D-transpeptidase [Pseudomonadota bacterium]
MELKPGRRMFPLFSILVFLLFFSGISPAYSRPAMGSESGAALVPENLLKWQGRYSPHAVLVNKSEQKVYLYHKNDLYNPVKVYPCSTGENGEPKTRQNDKKTPEGIYFFVRSFEEGELAPLYGSRAFALDYPNPLDRKEGRGGYGIWFHGTNKPLKPNDTNGCIVLENRHIDDLASYIRLNDTPVIISSRMKMVHPETLRKEREHLEETIEYWRKSWESKWIDQYMSVYSASFSSDGKDWRAWRDYKTHLAKNYKEIQIGIDHLQLFRHDEVIVALFDQSYRTARFKSEGEKRLFFKRNSDQWKIVGEFFDRGKRRQPVPEKPQPSMLVEIKRFIDSWKAAWEGKDIHTYMLCYAPTFRSRGMDIKAWERHRRRLNERSGSLKVEVRDLEIVMDSNMTAKATFYQSYEADEYQASGLKILNLTKRGAYWKIVREEWRP